MTMMNTEVDILDTVDFDDDGFMTDSKAWTREIGSEIAQELGLTLTERHWIVIDYARKEFFAQGDSPTLRKITKQTPVKMKELYELFPGGPAKIAAQISGLPKPKGCI